jgi:mono/diheme cytochrome c family protein
MARYPVRTDLMAVADLGAPPKWYSSGYPPLLSARLGARSPDPEFADRLRPLLGKAILDPEKSLTAAQRDDVGRFLDPYFGTPANPVVRPVTKEQAEKLKLHELFTEGLADGATPEDAVAGVIAEAEAARAALGLDDGALARGGVLYRRWCLQCHGPTGGGDGGHAIAANAMPRDYRQGVFKFITAFPTSALTQKGEKGKARKDDLRRVIRNGLDGSMMPPFPQFSDAELDDLAGYVIHLSVRGETEYEVLTRVISLTTNPRDDDPLYSPEFAEQLVAKNFLSVLGNWGRAERSPIPIPPENCPTEADRLASAVRGHKAFTNGGCLGCHANYGRDQQLKYDLWGTVVQPRDLVLGVYRGGRKGEDLYARVYGGIYPSTMPDYKAKLATTTPAPGRPDEVWDIVHFLQALSDPAGRRRMQELDPGIKIEP